MSPSRPTPNSSQFGPLSPPYFDAIFEDIFWCLPLWLMSPPHPKVKTESYFAFLLVSRTDQMFVMATQIINLTILARENGHLGELNVPLKVYPPFNGRIWIQVSSLQSLGSLLSPAVKCCSPTPLTPPARIPFCRSPVLALLFLTVF